MKVMNPSSPAAEMIIRNGRIATLEKERPFVPAVAIADGRFIAVGSEREVSLASGRNVVDTLLSQGVACEEIIVEKDKSFVYQGVTMSEKEGLDFLKKENALVFQAIHGTYGEDGELVKKVL